MAAGRKTGGGKKGTPNKIKATPTASAKMVKAANYVFPTMPPRPNNPPEVRFEAAKAALPFCHRPKDKEPATEDDDAAYTPYGGPGEAFLMNERDSRPDRFSTGVWPSHAAALVLLVVTGLLR